MDYKLHFIYTKHQSYLTKWLVLSLKLFQKTMQRYPKFVIDITIKDTKFVSLNSLNKLTLQFPQISQWTCKTVPKISTVSIILTTFLLSALLVKKRMFPLTTNMSIIHVIVSSLMVTFNYSFFLIAYKSLLQSYQFGVPLDALLGNKLNFPFAKIHGKQVDLGGWLLCYYIFGCTLFGIPLPFIVWYFEYDPISLIFTEILLLDYKAESVLAKILMQLTTLLLGIVFWAVFYKALGTILFIFILLFSCIHSYLGTLEKIGNFTEPDLLRHFICLDVAYKQFGDEIGLMALVLVVFSQSILTEAAWLAVSCIDQFPIFLTLTFTSTFVGGLGITAFLITFATVVRMNSYKLIISKVNQFKCAKTKDAKYYAMKWKVQQPVSIKCGEYFYFTPDSFEIFSKTFPVDTFPAREIMGSASIIPPVPFIISSSVPIIA